MNIFYVYIWKNKKTKEIFYVGLGSENRYKQTKQRNELFKKYYRNNKCKSYIYKKELDINEARQLEKELISKYKPCCNMTRGGERTNGPLISERLKGRIFTEEHRKKLSKATKLQWEEGVFDKNCKHVMVLDENRNIIKEFNSKYKIGKWLHEEFEYGKHARSIQRRIDPYFKTNELFDEKYFFVEINKKNE